jgi:hypothetical protein
MDLKILKQNEVEKAPEILVYFWIQTLGNFIHSMGRAYHRYGASVAVLDEALRAREDQELLVEMLKKRDGFAFADHVEYLRWFHWWHQWHMHGLPEERWNELDSLLRWDGTQTEETFAGWRPSGDWREVPETAAC